MRFQVAEIRDARTVTASESIEPQLLIQEPPEFVTFHRPLEATVQASITSSDVIVSGKIKTEITLQCARCLEKVDRPYEVSFQQVFSSDLKEIDISNDIRESVLIDLPFKSLCRDSCLGLCPTCGKNLNISLCSCEKRQEPRWDPLKNFPFK